jgi:hypothetical protein
MRSKKHPLALVLSLFAVLALFLGACSDGGVEESEPPQDTVEEEGTDAAAELDALCTTGREASDLAGDDLEAALEELGEADSSGDTEAYAAALDDAESAAEAIIDTIDDFLTDVEDVSVPADQQEALDEYVVVKEEQLVLAEDLRDAIASDDGDAFNEVAGELEDAEEDHDERSLEAAETLGASECEPDSGSDDADDSSDDSSDDSDDSGSDDEPETFDPDNS